MRTSTRPVFLIGAPFSGTSILQWSLAQHPAFMAVLDTSWLRLLARELRTVYEAGVAKAESSQLVAMRATPERFFAAFGDGANDLFLGASCPGEGAESGMSRVGAGAGSAGTFASPICPRRWVDATPESVFHVAGALNLFPRAQFIHVIRDAREAALALAMSAPARWTEEGAYEHWLAAVRAGVEAELAFGTETILRMRYADLLAAPEETLRECLAFLGEPFADACLRPLRSGGDMRQPQLAPPAAATAAAPRRTDSAARREAEFLSRVFLADTQVKYPRDEERVALLRRAFDEAGRRQSTPDRPGIAFVDRSPVARTRQVVAAAVPPGARVIVVSKGDEELVKLDGCEGWHFPQTPDGVYAGYHPKKSEDAISHLEALRARGADYLLIPNTSFWWLNYYAAFREHLEVRYPVVAYQHDACLIFALRDVEATVERWVSVCCAPQVSPAASLKASPTAVPKVSPAATPKG